MKNHQRVQLRFSVALSVLVIALVNGTTLTNALALQSLSAQEILPGPPADHTLIYAAPENGALGPLAFEAGTTPLRIDALAKGDKRSYVELKGASAATVITYTLPRFYLFLPDEANAKPPFLVRLTAKRGVRRVDAMAQKGYKGFAIASEDIIKPHYRVLRREGGMQFMEIRPREPLVPGEYAIIGTDLTHIATFRVASSQ